MCWCEIGCSFLPLWMHVSLGCWGEISCFLVPHLDASVNQVPRWEWLFFSALSGCKCHSGAEVRLAVFFCPVWMQVSLRCWGEIGCSFLPHLEQLMQMSLRCWGGIACLSLPISECKCCWGALFDCSGSVLTISLAWQCSSRDCTEPIEIFGTVVSFLTFRWSEPHEMCVSVCDWSCSDFTTVSASGGMLSAINLRKFGQSDWRRYDPVSVTVMWLHGVRSVAVGNPKPWCDRWVTDCVM